MSESNTEARERLLEVRFSKSGATQMAIIKATSQKEAKKQIRKEHGRWIKFISFNYYE